MSRAHFHNQGSNANTNRPLVTPASRPGAPEKYEYYADQFNRWAFYTGEEGKRLLEFMDIYRQRAMLLCEEQLDSRLDREGREIYERKPNKNESVITWSLKDYEHIGFQRRYIELKSIQRFTEMYSFLERALLTGALDDWVPRSDDGASGEAATKGSSASTTEDATQGAMASGSETADGKTSAEEVAPDQQKPLRKTMRIVSIGGGPGFELIACKAFFNKYAPDTKLELITLDYMEGWRAYNEMFNIEFHKYDMLESQPSLESILKGRAVDMFILSYVFFHYFRTDAHLQRVLDLLAPDPVTGRRAHVYILERSENMNTLDRLVRMARPAVSTTAADSTTTTTSSEGERDNQNPATGETTDSSGNQDTSMAVSTHQAADTLPASDSVSTPALPSAACPIRLLKVIDQTLMRDDRQTVVLAEEDANKLIPWNKTYHATYPNVPYEEHKPKILQSGRNYHPPQQHQPQYQQQYQQHNQSDQSYRFGGRGNRGGYGGRRWNSYEPSQGQGGNRNWRGHESRYRPSESDKDKEKEKEKAHEENESRSSRRPSRRSRSRSRSRTRSRSRSRHRRRSRSRTRSRSRSRSRDHRRRRSRSRSRDRRKSRRYSRSRSRDRERRHRHRSRSTSRSPSRSRSRSRDSKRDRRQASRDRSLSHSVSVQQQQQPDLSTIQVEASQAAPQDRNE